MRIKYISFKMVNGRTPSLDELMRIGPKKYEFFKQVIQHMEGKRYISGESREKVMRNLKISHVTYWKRLKEIEDMGMLIKVSRGNYRISSSWTSIFEFNQKTNEIEFKNQ